MKTPRRRTVVNYRSPSTQSTLAKQARLLQLLAESSDGYSVAEIGRLLGISRQLALYHVKKLAASYQVTMILEPCLGNGGLQFRVWDEAQVAAHYARLVPQLTRLRAA